MQINRLFEIIYLLLEHPTMTAAELAGRFEVSVRTIYRDIDTLSAAGIPVYMSKGRGGGISLLPDFVLNKTVLTEEEKREILTSMKAFREVSLNKEQSAYDRVDSLLGGGSVDWVEIDFSSWGYFKQEEEFFGRLKDAVLQRRICTISYASGRAERTRRTIYPLKLVFKGNAWYLYAYCTLREAYRFFKLRRISELELHEEHFVMETPANVLEGQRIDISCAIRTVLRIDSTMSWRVYDEMSDYVCLEDGSFECTLYMPDIETICSYAATFGAHCAIVQPEEAVQRMKAELKKTLENYPE